MRNVYPANNGPRLPLKMDVSINGIAPLEIKGRKEETIIFVRDEQEISQPPPMLKASERRTLSGVAFSHPGGI